MQAMKKILILAVALLVASGAYAQREETLFNQTRLDLTGFWFSDSHNFTFLDNDAEYFSGGNFAFEFGRSLMIGWAWQRMKDYAPLPTDNAAGYKLRNRGLLIGYAPGTSKVIHPYLSAIVGGGRIDFDDRNLTRDRVFVLQPAVGLEVNVFRWLRLGAEGGYRLVTDVNVGGLESSDVSKPFAQLQLRFGYSWGNTWR
jgi:hypothetical protein